MKILLPNAVDIGLKHVLAQSYYKIGSYEKALELYKELIKNNQYDDELDLVINEKAIVSQLNFQKVGKLNQARQLMQIIMICYLMKL